MAKVKNLLSLSVLLIGMSLLVAVGAQQTSQSAHGQMFNQAPYSK